MSKSVPRLLAVAALMTAMAVGVAGCTPLGFLFGKSPIAGPSIVDPETGVRAVWMWGSTVRAEGAENVAERLERHHINTVILLVRGTSGTVAYKSELAPASDPTQDPLADLIAACHPRGIQVHAWFCYNHDAAFADANPSERLWHHGNAGSNFEPYEVTDGRVCPASEAHLDYTKEMVREVLENYDVDGIQLDYIRYGHMLHCFCPAHVAKADALGINLARVRAELFNTFYASPADPDAFVRAYESGDPDVTAWVNMRRQEITDAAREIRDLVKSIKPNAAFSASLMPEGALESERSFADCHYGQNYADTADIYDFICPMAYHKGYGKSPSWSGTVAEGAIAATAGKCRVYGGVQAFGAVTGTDIAAAVQSIRDVGSDGFILFRYGTASDEWLGEVVEALTLMGPWEPSDEPITAAPSVASDSVKFYLNLTKPAMLVVTDLSGFTVFSQALTAGSYVYTWDLRDSSGQPLKDGVYVFYVSVAGEGNSWPQRLVIERSV